MKTIELTRGQVTIVDDEDFEKLNKHKWCALKKRTGVYYAVRNIKTGKRWKDGQKQIIMSREIMNVPKELEVDHRNHNTLDNRKHNLRFCTSAENCRNREKRSGCGSKHKGVDWHKDRGKWRGTIKVNNKSIYLGYFKNEDAAGRAYNEAAIKHFGDFALLNII